MLVIWPHPNRNVRHLIAEEACDYEAKGKCYSCGERYGPFLICASKHLSVVITREGKEMKEQVVDHAQNRVLVPSYPT